LVSVASLFNPSENCHCASARIEKIRNEILEEMLQTCKKTADAVVLKKQGKCNASACALREIGLMLKGFQAVGLFPLPQDVLSMTGCISGYWKGLKTMGANSEATRDVCSWVPKHNMYTKDCLDRFEVVHDVHTILEQYVHKDVWAQWESVSTLICPKITMLTEIGRYHKDLKLFGGMLQS
jgi:hypothetical protein